MARGRISRFPIDLRRRLDNTLALPCACVICTRTTYTSSSLRVGQKLRRKSEGLAYEKRRISIPLACHTPKNIPPGVRTPNSKRLTEALATNCLGKVGLTGIGVFLRDMLMAVVETLHERDAVDCCTCLLSYTINCSNSRVLRAVLQNNNLNGAVSVVTLKPMTGFKVTVKRLKVTAIL